MVEACRFGGAEASGYDKGVGSGMLNQIVPSLILKMTFCVIRSERDERDVL